MRIFGAIAWLVSTVFAVVLFLVVFPDVFTIVGSTALETSSSSTLGGKTIESLIGNVYKLIVYVPLLVMGFGLYYGLSLIMERERISGRF